MAPTRNNSTSARYPAKEDDGNNHIVECTGPGMDGNGRIIWTNVWVPTLFSNNFFSGRPFLCGFCAIQELQKMRTSTVDDRSPIIQAESIEKYGRKENVRIFGVEEQSDEDVFAKVVGVAEKAGVTITASVVSTCHRLQGGGEGPKPLFAKFVRRDSKHQLMKHKKNLKETTIFVSDNLTPLRAKITLGLRSKDDVRGIVIQLEKFFELMHDNQMLVFDNLYKLQNWDNELFSNACSSFKKYSL